MIPTDSLPIDRTDDGSGKHWCHHCMPAPLDPSLEGLSWDYKSYDHRHIVKDGKITIPTNWILHSWIHGDHIHFIWPDSPDRKFDGKIYAGELPEPDPFEPEPMYYQDTKQGKEWAEWAENEFLKHERPRELPDPEEEAKARKKLEEEYFEEKRKQKERDARIAEKLKTVAVTNKVENISTNPNPNSKSDFRCYIPNCRFGTNDRADYERHVVTKHPSGTLCYPGKIDLKMRGWKTQGRSWEI